MATFSFSDSETLKCNYWALCSHFKLNSNEHLHERILFSKHLNTPETSEHSTNKKYWNEYLAEDVPSWVFAFHLVPQQTQQRHSTAVLNQGWVIRASSVHRFDGFDCVSETDYICSNLPLCVSINFSVPFHVVTQLQAQWDGYCCHLFVPALSFFTETLLGRVDPLLSLCAPHSVKTIINSS